MTAGPFRIEDADGVQALDQNQLMSLVQGNSVLSGLEPSYSGTGTDIDIASGSALVNGSEVSVSATTINISDGDADNPRKDLLAVDSTGSVVVYEGKAEAPVPKTQTKFKTARPAPEDLNDKNEVAVAEVWVPAGASSLDSRYIRDRRVISDIDVNTLKTHGDIDANSNDVVNASNLDNRQVPVGGIIQWHKSKTGTPSLPENYAECNGQTISDAESPYDGQTLPDLNGENRFLRGNGTSGGSGGTESNDLSHTHNIGGEAKEHDPSNAGDFVDRNGQTDSALGSTENRPPYFNVVHVMRIK